MSVILSPTIYIPTSDKVLSQKKLEAYETYTNIILAGRRNPIWFDEEILGIKLMDYQKWIYMNSWCKPYVLWLLCRGAGKTMEAAIFLATKMLLIPSYRVYIATLTAAQSIEVFKKIEDIALQRIPSLKTCTDILAMEVERGNNSSTGFVHDPAGHHFQVYNSSELITLSSNIDAVRGKRGSVFFDECGWQNSTALSTMENFTNVDSDFSLGVGKQKWIDPKAMPLQLLYSSSASDATYPFYEKYKQFAKKMLAGDPNYFVCDLNANVIVNFSTVDGVKIASHLKQENIDKQIAEDPEAAQRELFNKFTTGRSGDNCVVKMEVLLRNTIARKPVYFNDTGKRKFILCYDPARAYDGSILGIFELIDDPDRGLKLDLVNMISMVDTSSKHKTPLLMPEQVEILKQMMCRYNGDADDWENIELYIDAGAGGGGVSAVADNLLADWEDEFGGKHRGVIDPTHPQYESSKKKYPHALPIVHLIEPKKFKAIIYNAFEQLSKQDLISYPNYDGKDFLILESKDHKPVEYKLSPDEIVSLKQCTLAIRELSYMCKTTTSTGSVTYELVRDKRNSMHDDRAYVCALAAYALSTKRRTKLIDSSHDNVKKDFSMMYNIRPPKLYKI